MSLRPVGFPSRVPSLAPSAADPAADWDREVRQALDARARFDQQPARIRSDEQAIPVQPGDTLYGISHGELREIRSRNPQIGNPDRVRAGDVVFVRKEMPPPFTASYDPKSQLEPALRATLAARYLGGVVNGQSSPMPEEAYGVSTDELAEAMSGGNPLEGAALASVYGGHDIVTGDIRKPLWEEMGISRQDLQMLLVEKPWEVASHHLGRNVSSEGYARLQKTDGPLGSLLNMGVDPATALSIQATWSAHFHGGYDPVTQASLQPVWERWGLRSADQLQPLFENTPIATAKLVDLTGGKDPITGEDLKAPWGDATTQAYGAAQLKTAQEILGIGILPDVRTVVPAEDAEAFALGFTTPSGEKQLRYINPIEYAQSPAMRNALQMLGGNLMTRGMTDPLGGVGLFGLVKGYPSRFIDRAASILPRANGSASASSPVPETREVKYQAHGFFQVDAVNGGAVWLVKLQRLPKATEAEKQAAKMLNRPVTDPDSQFVKVTGHWTDAGGGVTVFSGRSDESKTFDGKVDDLDPEDSRGRTPAITGVNWMNAPDGTAERLGGALAAPFGLLGSPMPLNSQPHHSYGLQFQMGKTEAGDWVPSGIGTVTEWGTSRYQIWPMVTWDPDGGGLTGGSIWGGTGWTLGQVGIHSDPSRPTTRFDLLGGADGRTPSVSYSDPSVFAFDLGGMYGRGGRALGLGFSTDRSSNVEVSVDVVDGDADGAERKAKEYHGKLARGGVSPLDLPTGVRVASTSQDSSSMRVMGFLWYLNAGVSRGRGTSITTNISRTGGDTWTVARYDEPRSDWSWNVGVFGVGPGGHSWDAHMAGESLQITVPADPNGRPVLQPWTRAALDRYLADGLLPEATSMEGRFQGDAAETYRTVRGTFIRAEVALNEAKSKPGSADPAQEEARRTAVSAAERAYGEARGDLNDFLRRHLKPGDMIAPGLKIVSLSRRDTEGHRPTLLVPLASKTITRGETKTEKSTYHSYELIRKPMFGWESENQHAQRTGQGNDLYQLSSSGTAAGDDGHISKYLPLSVLEAVSSRSIYEPSWQAAVQRKADLLGTLSVQFTDEQIVALGKSLSIGSDGTRLWGSFASRASGALGEGSFLRKNPEYRDNLGDAYNLSLDAAEVAESYDLTDKAVLGRTFAVVDTPEAFSRLTEREQDAFVDIIARTGSADHSPFEVVALISAAPSEDRRSSMFKRVIETVAEQEHPFFMNTNGGAVLDPATLGPNDRGPERVVYFEDPTVEFVRFLEQDVTDQEIRSRFLQQSGFEGRLPSAIESRRGRPIDELEREAGERYGERTTLTYTLGPMAPVRYLDVDASAMVGILVAVAEQKGSDEAWALMRRRGIVPAEIFGRLRTDDGEQQILRGALVDVLRPGSIGQSAADVELINREAQTVEDYFR
ncbi:LysM peptidoglycan-binding domain-containing protein [Inquilinus sp. OTU3971]|uniref:LysM peptidoglycan-binding domain-containing protein n=1 Tax=Inquilinus sp. OTU3971 TaxID=3043855 RepID=UPI00313BE5BD